MGDNLILGKFVSTFQIRTQDLKTRNCPKMEFKGSRSTINYKSQPLIPIGDGTSVTTNALVSSLDKYDISLGMPYLTAYKAIIDCGNTIITFPKKRVTLTCKKANNTGFSAQTNSDTTDFISEFSEVFPTKKIRDLQPLRKVNCHTNLIQPKSPSSPKTFTVPDQILPTYRQIMEDWKAKQMIYPCEANNPVNMVPKLKPMAKSDY